MPPSAPRGLSIPAGPDHPRHSTTLSSLSGSVRWKLGAVRSAASRWPLSLASALRLGLRLLVVALVADKPGLTWPVGPLGAAHRAAASLPGPLPGHHDAGAEAHCASRRPVPRGPLGPMGRSDSELVAGSPAPLANKSWGETAATAGGRARHKCGRGVILPVPGPRPAGLPWYTRR